MRAHSTNFSLSELERAVDMAHKHESRLYVCTNTMMRNQDLHALEKMHNWCLTPILSIIFLELIRDHHLEAHYSVQGNASNTRTLHTLKKTGC